MEPPAARSCPNCKKEVPEFNYQLHSIYCVKNLKICQQCNEPVAITDMGKHTAQVPCGQCGEVMQACDIPSHKTDACSMTQVQCAFCELQLERSNMAEHELYCGTRTEACSDCGELVMIKYQKLHEESNHGFLKLDDEPGPVASWKIKTASTINNNPVKNHASKYSKPSNFNKKFPTENNGLQNPHNNLATNLQFETATEVPQILTSRGAIKKRIAPQPPIKQNPQREVPSINRCDFPIPMYKAMEREQTDRRRREAENQSRREQNLPPILTAAEKVDKLRKMSNQGVEESKVKKSHEKKIEKLNGVHDNVKKEKRVNEWPEYFNFSHTDNKLIPINASEFHAADEQPVINSSHLNKSSIKKVDRVKDNSQTIEKSQAVRKVKNSIEYFNYDHENDVLHDAEIPEPLDRFPGIKNDLQALRRELQKFRSPLEVKKTPNKKENDKVPKNHMTSENMNLYKLSNEIASSPALDYSPDPNFYEDGLQNVMLPCEFCEEMIPANSLVIHETGCRPLTTSFSPTELPNNTAIKNEPTNVQDSTKNITPTDYVDKVSFQNKTINEKKKKKTANTKVVPIVPPDIEYDESDEVKLPCEFCMSLIPACRLVWHQEACLRA